MLSSRRLDLIRVALLALVFCGHVLSTNQIHTDSAWYIPSAISVLRESDTDLDEYERLITSGDYKIETIRGHLYTIFPVGPISLPFVWALDSIAGLLGIDIHEVLLAGGLDTALIEEVIASFLVAACALVLFETARAAGQPHWVGAVGALVFAFGTSAWSTASRALWQHGPSMLMLALAVYLLVKARRSPHLAAWAVLPLAVAYITRPTNAIPLALLSAYVLWEHRRQFGRFVGLALAALLPFTIFNLSIYHALLSPYYAPARQGMVNGGWLGYVEVLIANLVSPGRGLLFYGPVFLFGLIGFICKPRQRLDFFLAAIVGLHWLAISSFYNWTGGYQFGPRLFTEMLPLFTYYLFFGLRWLAELEITQRRLAAGTFAGLALLSAFIHFRGTNYAEALEWSLEPEDIRFTDWRSWDLSDISFLRGIGG